MVVTAEDVVITFDGSEDVTVTVPDEYMDNHEDHRLAGLCGNLDGNVDNDLVDYAGKLPRKLFGPPFAYKFSKIFLTPHRLLSTPPVYLALKYE